MFMMSSGGLTAAELFRGKDAILSGPAGGVVGMAETGRAAGFSRLIGFDMGGTSTDVSHFAGEYERAFETEVAGVRMRAPMMLIHTVAAGGGSILHFDGARFRVGPDSAGANPGPKCYRRGGPLAVTDANVMVGKLISDFFPKIFGPAQNQPLDADAVRAAFAAMAKEIGDGRSSEQVADGFIKIAVENMANAIKKISVQRGYDVTRYALNCFGGAGGQHACLVADALGMSSVLIHPLSSLLSAYGMGLADIRSVRQQAIEEPFGDKARKTLETRVAPAGTRDHRRSHRPRRRGEQDHAACARAYPLRRHRYAADRRCRHFFPPPCGGGWGGGSGGEVASVDACATPLDPHPRPLPTRGRGVEARLARKMKSAFERAHKAQFGFIDRTKELVIEAVSVEAVGGGATFKEKTRKTTRAKLPKPARRTRFFSGGKWHRALVYTRDTLAPGHKVKGPAIIIEPHQTVVVEHGWQAELTAKDHLVLRRVQKLKRTRAIGTHADPVMLEVFNNLFMSIAEQMGVALQNTAYSVNIKERLDFSCAVFDGNGSLVANAPHMPVHLGSMDRAVETIIRENKGKIRPGDVYAINAPYNGGTHLPDITVCTPVFDGEQDPVLGRLARPSRRYRRHFARLDVAERHDHRAGRHLYRQFQAGRSRPLPRERDLSAAARRQISGAQSAAERQRHQGADRRQRKGRARTAQDGALFHACRWCAPICATCRTTPPKACAASSTGCTTAHSPSKPIRATTIKVRITVDKKKREATVDFTGTSPQQASNFNAPEPVTRAAVLYVFRVMVDDDIPMNAGCLRPIHIIIPKNSMLAPEYPAAVVAGNVETSQEVTNCLFGALGAMAAAQGTMNNLNFGNARYQYYETICSGSPAGPGFPGTDAVHTHMTNTRLTDPEILEFRYPVLLEDFHIRKGSGGSGQWNAGDGIRRTIRFLEKMECTILSGHRRVPPFGLAGGGDGQIGENSVRRKDGQIEKLQGCDATVIDAGEAIIIQTPTAGGYGEPANSENR